MENQKRELTQEERIAIIKAIHEDVVSNGLRVNAEGKALVEELKAEKATEDLVVEHGLLDATNHDVEDEVEQLDSVEESVDFDSDENEVDMTLLSPNMREVAQ
tara:strand:+ start:216 stop:524 length:309 start_codon:yes stop_codon:yes gene_type:complete